MNDITSGRSRFYYDGAHYLTEHPEFKDITKISSVLKILEERTDLLDMLQQDLRDSGIKIHIGNENEALGLNGCTIITANYSVEDNFAGTLGIIGPMRMEYERIIPTVRTISDSVSILLEEIF